VDGGTAAGTCAITAGVLTCNIGDLASGASATVHISSPTTRATCGAVDNTGAVTSTNALSNEQGASLLVFCPDLQLGKAADAGSVVAGSPIGFTLTVTNAGAGTAKGVTLSDPLPAGNVTWGIDGGSGAGSCSIGSGTLTCSFGDLAPGASVDVHISSPTTSASCASYPNTASAQATNNPVVQAQASTDVTCPVQATRTLGFWQTHTNYTIGVFQADLGGNVTIGTNVHHKWVNTTGKLFGGFYANVSKTSSGTSRTTLAKDRMVLLQQLLAAELNCSGVFGACNATITSLLSSANAAYGGTNLQNILNAANALDAFNQSGDGVNVPNTGSATPDLSKAQADIKFWDAP
jgi:uncharacterized repeat protein (TIGR01451 family)